MAVIRENLISTLIQNTTMQKIFINGEFVQYGITSNENYVLHDKILDNYMEYDEEGNGIGEPTSLGFYKGTRTVRYDYDFDVNEREFYAVLENEVPEGSQIF